MAILNFKCEIELDPDCVSFYFNAIATLGRLSFNYFLKEQNEGRKEIKIPKDEETPWVVSDLIVKGDNYDVRDAFKRHIFTFMADPKNSAYNCVGYESKTYITKEIETHENTL